MGEDAVETRIGDDERLLERDARREDIATALAKRRVRRSGVS
jgi:hypothetical protein